MTSSVFVVGLSVAAHCCGFGAGVGLGMLGAILASRRRRSGLSYESRAALFRCRWRLGNDGGHTIWVDVEGQERQRLIARVSPLVDKAEWLVDQRARPSLLCFASHRVSSRSRDNIVESRSRAMVWRVRGHACRESDPRKIEIITA